MVGIKEDPDKFEDSKVKRRRVSSSHIDPIDRQKLKRVHLCKAKPSYLLTIGPKASRSEYLSKLPGLLRELLRKRNWTDASRVLSVLMKGTLKDPCPKMTRLKYEAHIQIVSHSDTKKNKADEIGRIYDTWIGQIGKQHKEERLLVWYEQICHFIEHGMNNDAYSAAISLMQNRDFGMLPRANLFIGLIFYKLWCSKFLKELQPEDAASVETVSDLSQSRPDSPVQCSGRDESIVSVASEVSARNGSETSVMYCKKVSFMSITDSGTKMDTKVKLENTPNFTTSPQLYATSEETETSLRYGVEFDPTSDMDPWLLPLTPPDDRVCYKKIDDDSYYKEAVKYLRQSLQSPRHVCLDALHPLVKLLLIRGRVYEAMEVAEEMCNKVHDLKSFRIKALMMEIFHRNYPKKKKKFHVSSDMLAKCYEDILKIDPSCVTTLKKLIGMCVEGEYSRESLIEMIGLHVEASFPEPEMWKELASCFSHLFENLDEDRMSVCLDDGSGDKLKPQTYSVRYNRTPKMFSNTSWNLRAKWWLNRHFSQEMLETELKKGEWEMMTYKAACASHIYGQDFGYVTKVYGGLKNSNNTELFKFLREHTRNWNKIYNFE